MSCLSLFSRLGEDEGSMLLSWTTLNPMQLVRAMNAFSPYFDFKSFEEYMRRVSDGSKSCEFQSGERQMRGCFEGGREREGEREGALQ